MQIIQISPNAFNAPLLAIVVQKKISAMPALLLLNLMLILKFALRNVKILNFGNKSQMFVFNLPFIAKQHKGMELVVNPAMVTIIKVKIYI